MKNSEKYGLIFLMFFAAGALFGLFYVRPTLEELGTLRTQVADQEANNEMAMMRTVQYNHLRQEVYGTLNHETGEYENSLYEYWRDRTEYILPEFVNTHILRDVEALIRRMVMQSPGLTANIGSPTRLSQLYVYPLNLGFVVENQQAFFNILEAFENMPMANRIVNYSVTARDSNAGVTSSELTVSLTVEFLAQSGGQ